MLSPVNIDYDPSNGSWNVFCIEVLKVQKNWPEEEVWELQPYAFQSLGHAMKFLQPQIERPLVQRIAGGMWQGDLKQDSPLAGLEVRIQQLVMVLDNDPKAKRSAG